jgi:hypothetical protein
VWLGENESDQSRSLFAPAINSHWLFALGKRKAVLTLNKPDNDFTNHQNQTRNADNKKYPNDSVNHD